jgi:uncharacterized protein YcnI
MGRLAAMRRPVIAASAACLLGLGAIALAPVGPASAHAIIQLNGVSAVAGSTGAMTLEIQHGCLPAEATTQVEAFVGTPWRAVTPGQVAGWRSSVERLPKGGWHIVWTNLGEAIPFGTATFFPITVDWPTKPGAYSMRVTQQCTNGTSYDWNTKYGPATANRPSPPLTPRPEVQVVAKAEKAKGTSRPPVATPVDAHGH